MRNLSTSCLPPLLGALLAFPLGASTGAAPVKHAIGDTGVLRATLPNGLRVVIVRNPLAPVVTTQINYLVGSNEAPEGFPGSAHALEHMMFRGSKGLSREQLAQIAAAMGGDYNAQTTQTVTQYFYTAPASDLDVALRIEAIRMQGLELTKAGWDKERGAIEQEVSMDHSNPQYKFYSQLLAAMFKGTPYAHDALGTRASFDKTTAEALKQFHDQWYAPNNAILVIVGDVKPQAALAQVRKLFGRIPRKTLPTRPGITFSPVQPATLTLPTDLPVGIAALSYRMPSLTSKDYAAAQILSDVLGSQRGDLFALVPQGKALFAGFQFASFHGAGLGFALAAFPKGGDAQAVVSEMKAILATTLQKGVSPELVEASKRNEIASLEFNRNSISGLASAWSSALAFQDLESPEAIKSAFQAVTVEDVNRVAREVLDPAHAITAVLTPEASGKPVSGKGFGGAESFGGAGGAPVKLPVWAEKALGKLEVPASSIHPVVKTLPNGLRLIVQPEQVSDTVSVFGSIRTNPDLQQPKGKEGVAEVLGQLFSYGTTQHDRLAFLKALDGINANSAFGTSFSTAVPAAHFDQAVELLAEAELHPALPPQAFEVVKRQTAQALAGQLQSPGYLLGRALDKALVPAGDPTLREATPATVSGLTLADVQAYHAQVFRPDLTTVVVVGKVTPAEAERVVTKYFGTWTATGPKPQVELPAVRLNAASQAVVPDATSVQDTVHLVENLGLNLKDPDHFAINLGNQVLSGGTFASRLYRDLRVKAGLVYYVGGSAKWGLTRSTFAVQFGCDPDKVAQARGLVIRDLKQLQDQPVTADELARAKGQLMRTIPLGESSVAQIGQSMLYLDQNGLPLDASTQAARHYLTLTPAQVQAAFKKWLGPDRFATVIKGPAPK